MKTKALLAALAIVATSSFTNVAQATLLAHYSFDDLLTDDSSGNGRTLTNNGATTGAGVFGSGASFDGNDFLSRNDAGLGLLSGDFSVAFWYQSSATSLQTMVSKNSTSGDDGWDASIDSTNLSANLDNGFLTSRSATRPAGDNIAFHHVVMQRNTALTTFELFIDGVVASSGIEFSDPEGTGNAFAIGASDGGTSRFFTGLLDEVHIFDQALTQVEINNLITHNDIDGATGVSLPASSLMLVSGLIALRLRKRPARDS